MTAVPRVAVIVLNWRRPEDTISCVKSVAALDYANLDIIVCDNDSNDGSMEVITTAVREALPTFNHDRAARQMRPFHVEERGSGNLAPSTRDSASRRMALIKTGRNGGYAFGNNVGIRIALEAADLGYVWILNNDTCVDKNALAALVGKMTAEPSIGICGALVLYRERPDIVQTLGGGEFHLWRARGKQVGSGLARAELPEAASVEMSLDYINGAASLVSRRLLETVGLMDEGYFLYFEEIDWARRAQAAGFRLGYCPGAIVFHQVGAATGSADDSMPSPASVYHAEKSKFRFLRRHHPLMIGIAVPLMLRAVAQRVLRGQRGRAMAMLRGAIGASPPHR